MFSAVLTWVLVAVSAPPLLPGAPGSDTLRKCGRQVPVHGGWTTPSRVEPVIFLDGGITTSERVSLLSEGQIYAVMIRCMNPQDSTLNFTQGTPAIVVWTRSGVVEAARGMLGTLLEAQDDRARRGLEYLGEHESMPEPLRPEGLRLAIEPVAAGWSAKATIDGLDVVCHVYDGAVPSSDPRVTSRRPVCLESP